MENTLIRILLFIGLYFLLYSDFYSLIKQATDDNEDNSQKEDFDNLVDDSDDETMKLKQIRIINTVKDSCLPKLICELNALGNKENLSPSELNLLSIIRQSSISTTAEVTSKYHFAAHMGQLIAGIEGAGCHNFYPDCPLQSFRIGNGLKASRLTIAIS